MATAGDNNAAGNVNIVQVQLPNYRIGPDEEQMFLSSKARKICETVVESKMNEMTEYDSEDCEVASCWIADNIKDKVTKLTIPRYKVIVQVTIGENKGQTVRVTSQCLWNIKSDNYASYSYKNEKLWCSVMVFGAYTE